MEYKKTLNLPKTDFPIKANLKIKEPEILTFWQKEDVYQKVLAKTKDQPKYVLHDGPPYPNGDIHLGHALNKILKDIVVKYKSMAGYHAPFIPGWDCHGLPIETQLLKELGEKRKGLNTIQFREYCREYALKYVDLHREEFKRLGVLGEWEKPYLTLDHEYEAKIIEQFGQLAEKGYVYRGLKPIHWCPNCETALAEAEIEYEDEKSPSIYVKFSVKSIEALSPEFAALAGSLKVSKASFLVWTTTPWTLPANVAVAVHPQLEYVAIKVKDEVYVLAEGLLKVVAEKLDLKHYKIIQKFRGKILEGIICQHPFFDRESIVVLDELVTLEQGTGLVHIAPGHGQEDYQVGLKYKLPIIMPVDGRGYLTEEAHQFAGKRFDEANKAITEEMKNSGALLKLEFMKHSYPHCWRCKKPVIFRATEQWFISIDHKDMRRKAITEIGNTKWYPTWGENRIRGMVESRPDWCISRQRSWGVPIPVFYCEACNKPILDKKFNQAVIDLVSKEGTDAWFKKEAEEIIPQGFKCPHCQKTKFRKETDILDVWFESGSSHGAVLETRKDLRWPADLYLEGSDQHRGWFQTSLLVGIGTKGKSPYKEVLTHGFTVDEKGKKMSKSSGNVVDPQDVVKKYGADVLRLWVASTDFRNDMSASEKILRQVEQAYTKIRNTCRFLISNINDFDAAKDKIDYNKMPEVDKFGLLLLNKLIKRVREAYDRFEFHIVYHSIYSFCVNEMSALYLDIVKDRLYCDGKDSLSRKSAQTVIREVLLALVRLLYPVLSFTAEDIWQFLAKGQGSVQLLEMPKVEEKYLDQKLETKWEKILEVREEIYRSLEEARNKKVIGHSLDALVEISAQGKRLELLRSIEKDLPAILIASQVKVLSGKENKVTVKRALGKKCERCWNWKESVGKNKEHSTLCVRCVEVVTK